MKKLFKIILLSSITLTKLNAQNIRLINPHSLDPGGYFLHNGCFGSTFNIGPTNAKIDFVQAQNLIASFKLMTTPKLIVDINNLSNGNPRDGGQTYNNSLLFGNESGEGISSKRNDGDGKWGLDFFTLWKNRMHIGNDGAVGVGSSNGQSPTKALDGRFNIHNYNSEEKLFYKNINLYTSSSYDAISDRTGISNHIWNSVKGNQSTINDFYNDINWLYPPATTLIPKNTIGINNNMRNITAPSLNTNPSIYSYTYGIMNDLNDKKIAGYKICPPLQDCAFFYQPRVGILNVTNTERFGVDGVSYGSGKIGVWSVNIGGYSGLGTAHVLDGWAQWNDGQTFLRYGYVSASDEKLKQNIVSLKKEETLSKLLLLNPVQYEFIDRPGLRENGLLAQNLSELFPETVSKVRNPVSKEELLGVNYQQLHSVEISSIQALQEIINGLEKRIKELEKQKK